MLKMAGRSQMADMMCMQNSNTEDQIADQFQLTHWKAGHLAKDLCDLTL